MAINVNLNYINTEVPFPEGLHIKCIVYMMWLGALD